VDFFDFIPIEPGGVSRDRPRNEEFAAALTLVLLPILDFCLVMFGGLADQPKFAMVWLPLLLVALSALIARQARVRTWQAFVMVLGCAFWSFFASACVVAMEIFILPW
jgi:hypothetical protein